MHPGRDEGDIFPSGKGCESEAQQADPSLVIDASAKCTQAETKDAKEVVFNPDGALAYIEPRGTPHTPEDLGRGIPRTRATLLLVARLVPPRGSEIAVEPSLSAHSPDP